MLGPSANLRMWFFTLITWVSYIVQILFFTLALASGLYYLAELVEEYTLLAARIIRYTILFTLCLYVGFWLFEGFPLILISCGIASQILHLILLKDFPIFYPVSPSFIGACILLALNHYISFKYFVEEYVPFNQVLAYFTLCLWLVPFALFVSLTANDQTLPVIQRAKFSSADLMTNDTDVVSNYFMKKQKYRSGLLSFFQRIKEYFVPSKSKRFA